MASLMVVGGALPMASQSFNLSSHQQLSFSRSEILGLSLDVSTTPVSVSIPATSSPYTTLPLIYCGRGDKKTAKGKRFKHSFGNARPRNKNKGRGPPRVTTPPGPPRKDEFDDGEIIEIELDEDLFSL